MSEVGETLPDGKPKRLLALACAVLARECYYCAAITPNVVDVELLDKGLHDIGTAKMRRVLQEKLDQVCVERYDAILLVYGLCNNGITGLHAPLPLVVPRAHDCITLFMGSKESYQDYFDKHCGVYYQTTGWIERGATGLANLQSMTSQLGIGSYQEYVEQYGEDNAKYIVDVLGDALANYDKLAYIDMHIGEFHKYREQVKRDASEKNWEYQEINGNLSLLKRLFDGDWHEDEFLVVPSGQTVEPTHDTKIVKSI